ncbi:probable E3 ubiquitin ligase complex SCF subunit sconB at N-terminal half [Coccomyxa sp. Obi]|nr:probable E3 ubiquitin ligase complex SCF subunit sconB at N-terminal half [Coccomyxa sp. Obi]
MEEHVVNINMLPAGLLHTIFNSLGPRDLCSVSATCKQWRHLNQDAAANKTWQGFFEQRWRPFLLGSTLQVEQKGDSTWQARYGNKMRAQRVFGGRARQDTFYGHKAGVRCLALLPSCNLMATGSVDRTVKLWDLNAGIQIATSRYQPCTVRTLALDARMLVCSASKVGSLRVWKAVGSDSKAHFDLSTSKELPGHAGPVTSVAMSDECIFSGSWDYTVRIWGRSRLKTMAVLSCSDWVWGVCPRGPNLLVAAGRSACVFDQSTSRALRRYDSGAVREMLHSPRVEGTRDGRLLFIGNADGALQAFDLRQSKADPVATLWQQGSPVQSIAFDDPWLAAALDDGSALLLNVDAAMRGGRSSLRAREAARPAQAIKRQFVGSAACSAYCVDIADQWMASGSDAATVRTWDFSEANEVQERLDALRAARDAQRAQRRERGGQGGRKNPRFPPASGSNSGSEVEHDSDMHADHDSIGAGSSSSSIHANRTSQAERISPWDEPSGGSGEWRDMQNSEANEQEMGATFHRHRISLHPGCRVQTENDELPSLVSSEQQLSRLLPAPFPHAGAEGACFGRSPPLRALPPPVLRSTPGSTAEMDRQRRRMTSWDILRPRAVLDKEHKSGGDGIKVAG